LDNAERLKALAGQPIVIGAIDIGGTKVDVGIVDEFGVVLSGMEAPTGPDSIFADGLSR
jgi:predicted NBD/HSP70 family sugar kinase